MQRKKYITKKNMANVYALEVFDLKKKFKDVVALNGISFRVRQGEIYGLIGPNGAGKTTALRIVASLLTPTSGKVYVFGLDVVKNSEEVRKIIGYLPEEAGVYNFLTGFEYLKYMASLVLSDKKEIEEAVERGIKIADLGDAIHRKTSEYSKGMRRRLQLARVLMLNPKLVILDEPTAGLDVVHTYRIRKVLKDYVSLKNSVLLSSHNLLEVEFLCDRVAVISKGSLLAEGEIPELKARYGVKDLEELFMKVVSI